LRFVFALGKDVTGDFEAFFHSERARTIMKQFEIGIIEVPPVP